MSALPERAARVVDEARALVAIAAPPFAEAERATAFAERLGTAAGAPATIDATGNVIVALPADRGAGAGAEAATGTGEPAGAAHPVAFAAHLDTVFPAGTDLTLREEPGRLVGPGIGDNTLGVAALLDLARHLAGRPLARPVLLVGTVGEEGLGDLRGAKALVAARPLWGFVAVEGAMADELVTAGTGSIRLRLGVTGPGGHPWSDRGRPSAVLGVVDAVAQIQAAVTDPAVMLNVGTIRGGSAINVIAAEAMAELDLRAETEAPLARAAAAVRATAAETQDAHPGLTVSVDEIGHRPAGAIPPDHPLLLAARAARADAGLPPASELASSTDANAAHGAGIPALTVGITTGGGAHTPDDFVDLAPIDAGLAALRALADRLTA